MKIVVGTSICYFVSRGLLAGMVLSGMGVHAQTSTVTTSTKLEYEVVSVTPNNSGAPGAVARGGPGGVSYRNFTLINLLLNAYSLRPELVFGAPGWVKTDRFDVDVKVAGTDVERYKQATVAERQRMMRTVLTDRFRLKAHVEVEELPIYDLVVAKGGSKLVEEKTPVRLEAGEKPQPGVRYSGSMSAGRGFLTTKGTLLSVLTGDLASELQRNVVDKTGLTGRYDIDLKWAPDETEPGTATDAGPSIFTAVQEQLGLRLQTSKGPVETLVIDHVEKPSPN